LAILTSKRSARISKFLSVFLSVYGSAVNTGLQPGDVVHSVNNDFVHNIDGLRAAMGKFKSGDPVALLIERGEQLLYVAFELP
jgi:S1-C subfamily serine protease